MARPFSLPAPKPMTCCTPRAKAKHSSLGRNVKSSWKMGSRSIQTLQGRFQRREGGEPTAGRSLRRRCEQLLPQILPDGKWIIFCKSSSYMLLRGDSRSTSCLPRVASALMRCNTDEMNSWHSWSPNGKWLVFSSKANGPYTQLAHAH